MKNGSNERRTACLKCVLGEKQQVPLHRVAALVVCVCGALYNVVIHYHYTVARYSCAIYRIIVTTIVLGVIVSSLYLSFRGVNLYC